MGGVVEAETASETLWVCVASVCSSASIECFASQPDAGKSDHVFSLYVERFVTRRSWLIKNVSLVLLVGSCTLKLYCDRPPSTCIHYQATASASITRHVVVPNFSLRSHPVLRQHVTTIISTSTHCPLLQPAVQAVPPIPEFVHQRTVGARCTRT